MEAQVQRLRTEQESLLAGLPPESEADSTRRRQLVLAIDSIRREKATFKRSCREEKALLDQQIEALRSLDHKEQQQDDQEEEELAQLLHQQEAKRNKAAGILASVSKEVSRMESRLDDIPSRSEVTQYQRRFVELFEQIAAKHVETKNFFILFNQLDDTRLQLEREYTLLSSVLDSFAECVSPVCLHPRT